MLSISARAYACSAEAQRRMGKRSPNLQRQDTKRSYNSEDSLQQCLLKTSAMCSVGLNRNCKEKKDLLSADSLSTKEVFTPLYIKSYTAELIQNDKRTFI
jgi:hypothetical protein